jgi:hypothetical protein
MTTTTTPEHSELPLIINPANCFRAELTREEIADVCETSTPSVLEIDGRTLHFSTPQPGRTRQINWEVTDFLHRRGSIPPYCVITGTVVITKQ